MTQLTLLFFFFMNKVVYFFHVCFDSKVFGRGRNGRKGKDGKGAIINNRSKYTHIHKYLNITLIII